jgi:hypothetical protein
MSDTLLDGLGRAYSSYAMRFSWYQYGGKSLDLDSVTRRLGPLELPSPRRVDSVNKYISAAADCFDLLAKKSPHYITVVGNSGMKAFNEKVHGYSQTRISGYEAEARKFLQSIKPNEALIRYAKNYLDACAMNAILFTYGDNDTYPLFYVQEQLEYRKDVSVVNTSLLGVSHYVAMLKRDKTVAFTTASSVFGHPKFLYVLAKPDLTDTIPVSEFLSDMSRQVMNPELENVPRFSHAALSLQVDETLFGKLNKESRLDPVMYIPVDNYLTSDQLLLLDMVISNLYERPLFFTAGDPLLFPHLIQEGLIYRLLPFRKDLEKEKEKMEIQSIETFLLHNYKPSPSNDFAAGITPANAVDGTVIYMYQRLVRQSLDQGNKKEAVKWLDHLLKTYNHKLPFLFNQGETGLLFLESGRIITGNALLTAFADSVYRQYKWPTSNYFYMTKDDAKMQLQIVQQRLKELQMNVPGVEAVLAKLEE